MTADGKRCVLGCSVAISVAEAIGEPYPVAPGPRLSGIRCVVSDDQAGVPAALEATLPGVPWQRRQFHLIQNAMAYVHMQSMRSDITHDIRRVFAGDASNEAERD